MRNLTVATIIISLVLISQAMAPRALAEGTDEVLALTRGKIEVVINLLKSNDIGKEERNEKIIAELNPIFDFETMARLSLGKKHWGPMSAAQKKEFSDVFVQHLKDSLVEKLDLYTDEDVIVEEAKQVKKRIHVLTRLVSKDDKKDMIFKFYKTKKGWKVYDAAILGVSVVQTYRSQFSGLLKQGSMDDLLKKLRTKGGVTISTDKK